MTAFLPTNDSPGASALPFGGFACDIRTQWNWLNRDLNTGKVIMFVCMGAGVGFCIAAITLWGGDPAIVRVVEILETPPGLLTLWITNTFELTQGRSVLWWFLLRFIYWMLIGATVAFGIARIALRSSDDVS